MNQLYRISQVRIAMCLGSSKNGLLNCGPASDQRDELALGIGIAVDIPLRCLN